LNLLNGEIERLVASPPAIAGGQAIFPQGPPAWPLENLAVSQSIQAAMNDGSWGKYHGRNCQQLIEKLCRQFDFSFGLLCCSGTIATEIALRAVDARPGSEVILAGYDFPGNFRAIESLHAMPVLCDIASTNWSLDPTKIETCLTAKTSAVIASHLHGGIVDMPQLRANLPETVAIVEDGCQNPGARWQGQPLGRASDVLTLSFGGSKLLTSGRGGALLTNREDVFQRAKIFCERGNDAFALSELQAAALLPQLDTLHVQNLRRAENVRLLDRLLPASWKIHQAMEQDLHDNLPAFYKVSWLLDPAGKTGPVSGVNRESFIAAMQAEGVALDAGFRGFANRSSRRCHQPVSLEFAMTAAQSTVLLHHPILLADEDAIQRLAAALIRVSNYFASRRTAN
jgi:dTDP-4-amino-4,6-dideoxygalactose transaminase